MASRTAAQIRDIVIGRIGGRASGKIGDRNIDDVVLDAINDSIKRISKRPDVPEMQDKATQQWTTSDYQYDLPTTNLDGNEIRIKSIFRLRAYQVGTINAFTMEKITPRKMDALYPIRNLILPKRPQYYCIQEMNVLELDAYPNCAYTADFRVTVWPSRISIDQTQPYQEEWDDVIEAFTTADVFNSLQLTDDAIQWERIAEARFLETIHAKREDPDLRLSLSPDQYRISQYGMGSNPGTDPYVRRM